MDTKPEQEALRAILTAAGRAGLRHFHEATVTLKADGSQVTRADTESEAILVEALLKHSPGVSIVAEEGHRESGVGHATWYVDPVDGTGAFVDGMAYWGPTICLVDEDGPVVGATWFPRMGEFWYARRGEGAWRDDHRLRIEARTSLRPNDAFLVPSRFHNLPAVPWKGKVRALGSTAAHQALVAGGGPVGTVIGGGWRMWDVGAGSLMVTEAGRTIVDISGEVYHPKTDRGDAFIAGDARSIEAFLPMIRAARPTK
jgi:myo-inositol-1(or 4)-monophosphatase